MGLKIQAVSLQRIHKELRWCYKLYSEGHNFCFGDSLRKVFENALKWVGF